MAPRGGKGGEGGEGKEGGVGSTEREGYLFVMDKRAGERGKFQSRVDGMVGDGEGGVHV